MSKNKNKIWYYLTSIVGYTLELLLLLFIVLAFAIQAPVFQTKLAKRATVYLEKELNTKISIDKIKVHGLHYVKLEGLYIEDLKQDTLLYVASFISAIENIDLKQKKTIVEVISAKNARVNVQKHKGDSVLNFIFLKDYFAKDPEDTTSFAVKLDEIHLSEVHFSYNDRNVKEKPYGIDYSHIDLTNLHGVVNNFSFEKERYTFSLNHLCFNERSGFEATNLTAKTSVTPKEIIVRDIDIQTPKSDLKAEIVRLKYRDFADFKDFVNAVYMEIDMQNSKLNLKDLSYFAPAFKNMSSTVRLKGKVKGPVNEMYLDDLYFGLSDNTYISCNAEIKGLPYLDEALFYIDVKEAQTYRKDLDLIDFKSLGLENDIKIPAQLAHLGVLNVSGVIDGFYNDFLLNVDVATDLGAVDANLACRLDAQNKFNYKGIVSTDNFDLGTVSGVPDLGLISSDLEVDGKGVSTNDLSLKLKGVVPLFEYKNYAYKNITIDGVLEKLAFDGKLKMEDNNIDFNFDGGIDMNTNPMSFNFKSELQKAYLSELNFLEGRESATICLSIEANGFGTNLDDFTGYVHFNDVAYYENGKDYYFDSILFESQSNSRYHSINVYAQFAELSMNGTYSLDSLPQSLYGLGAKILPSIFTEKEIVEIKNQQFDLDLKVHDLSMLTALFYPELSVSNQTEIKCQYTSQKDLLELYFYSDFIQYKDVVLKGVRLDTTKKIGGFDPFYVFDFSIDSFIPKENILIENINILTKAYLDNVGMTLVWGDDDSTYWGRVGVEGYVLSPTNYEMEILPSTFYGKKIGEWEVQRSANVSVDTTAVEVDNLVAHNGYQTVRLNGKFSERPIDQMNFELGSFELANINDLIAGGEGKTKLGGIINLSGFVSDVYHDMYFDAYSWVDDLMLNEELIGDLELNSNWNAIEERIEILGNLERENGIRDFKINKGFYYPKKEKNNLDFVLDFQNTDLTFVNAFLPEAVSNLKGELKGQLNIKGELETPKLNGNLFLDSAQATVTMLNTTYYTRGQIKVEEDLIGLEALPIKDKYGTEATLVGSFMHTNFTNYSYDFFAFFDEPLLVMNTNYEQNSLYYGTAFATGDVSIGYENILEINVNAKSEKGTNVTLPLYGSEDVVLEDFITFVNKENQEEDYEVDLDGINLNLSLDLTEDAEIQLVFDEVVGDAMKGRGVGHIDMYIDQFYDFYMFGNYTIKEGSYLFTLRDFINKKFKVKEGGTISWYGNPYDADIDIVAVYPLKASLYDIMPESERELYRQKVMVECEMHLTNSLFNPNIEFNIELPRSDENARSILANLVSTPTEMNRQVFSLLILNKFLPRVDAGTVASSGVIGATTTEVLSNQLSNMLANFTDNFDVGLNYRPGDEISNNEIAVALSTQLFNDKLTISTNLGVSSGVNGSAENESTSSFIGDVDVEYKLNNKGNVRVHAFNKSNAFDPTSTSNARNTQGVGIFYQESFNSFKELMCKLGKALKDNDCGEEE